MKTGIQIKGYALIAVLIVLFLLTLLTALVTYRYYGVVARGISGLVLLYLLYFFGRYSKMDVSLDSLLLAPNKGKYLISAFIGWHNFLLGDDANTRSGPIFLEEINNLFSVKQRHTHRDIHFMPSRARPPLSLGHLPQIRKRK